MPIAVAPVPGEAVAPEPQASAPLGAFSTQRAAVLDPNTVCPCAGIR
jgi:hypothetical protein